MTEENLKAALEAAQKADAEFKKAADRANAEAEKMGRVAAETTEKVAKINADVEAKIETAQKRWDEIERRANRGGLVGVGAEGKDLAARMSALAAFNRQAALTPGGVARKAMTLETYETHYKPAFLAYLRGKESLVEQMGPEFKAALSVGSDPSGGYLVPVDVTDRIVSLIYETSPLRARASVRKTSRDRIQIRRDLDKPSLGGWVGETATRSTSGTPQVPVPHEIPVWEQYAFPLISQQELDDADFDVEAWLVKQLGDEFARQENTAFVTGTGIAKPRGFASYAAGTPSKATFGVVEQIVTGAAAAFKADPNGPDVFINMMGKMKEPLLAGASWAMTRSTLAAARLLKDSYGRYQVQISQGLQDRPGFDLLGMPIDRFADMDELGANKLPVALANWAEAYQIVDHAAGLRVMRDPYTQKPNLGLYATKRTGGDIANFEAIKLAKCST